MLAWISLRSLPSLQYTIEQLAKHMVIIYSDYVSHPPLLNFHHQGISAVGLYMIQDLHFGGMILPMSVNVIFLQLFVVGM